MNEISQEIFRTKYALHPEETFAEACDRLAVAFGFEAAGRSMLHKQAFVPAGRWWSWAPSVSRDVEPKVVTPANCFVSGPIKDSLTGQGSIMDRLTEAAATLKMGGGIGYDFSTLRPRGAAIKGVHATSSGPVTFMRMFNAMCETIASAGQRRGAQMAVMRVDHPDIMEFINAKRTANNGLQAFNISVAVTDDFMTALAKGDKFDLKFDGKVYDSVPAADIWGAIMRSNWDWAEPGVLFIDEINRRNNLWYCENITATNPCAEQPLPPFGACLLGAFNLVKYRKVLGKSFDCKALAHDVELAVIGYNTAIDRGVPMPLERQQEQLEDTRRIGLGIMGLGTALATLGLEYGSPEAVKVTEEALTTIRDTAYWTSSKLAATKDAFPMCDRKAYSRSEFIRTLPRELRNHIEKHGTANSHLLTIAPTGTTSLLADNVSSGIEPIFALSTKRRILMPSGPQEVIVNDYGVKYGFYTKAKTAADCTMDDHLAMLRCAAPLVDSAVSKTVTVGPNVTYEQFEQVYLRAWQDGLKGCTTFRPGGKLGGVLVSQDTVEEGRPEAGWHGNCEVMADGSKNCG